MKKVVLLLSSLIIFVLNVIAQSSTDLKPYIEVTGYAEKYVLPDEIYIGIVLKEQYVDRVKRTIERQEDSLKSFIQSIGIDLSNLFLSDADANYVKVQWQQKGVISQKEYTLKVTDANTVGLVFSGLDKLNILDASILRATYSKMDSVTKEIKILAIKNAKEQADYMLEAIGEKTGKPLKIEGNSQTFVHDNIRRMPVRAGSGIDYSSDNIVFDDRVNRFRSDSGSLIEQELQFEKIKISYEVKVLFLIQ